MLENISVEKHLAKKITFKADTKILGMQWNPETDRFKFKIGFSGKRKTKRTILSCVAKSYDPLGLTAPCILYLKLLVKDLWKLLLDYADEHPERAFRSYSFLNMAMAQEFTLKTKRRTENIL